MSCTGCANDAAAAAGSSAAGSSGFDAAFAHFWPAGLPGPRLLPWLGAAASREDARAWAIAVGADRDPRVLAGDEQAMLHLVGLAMGGGGVYAQERKGRKKKGPSVPTRCQVCHAEALADCRTKGGVYSVRCPNGDGLCQWLCVDEVGGTDGPGEDLPGTEGVEV